MIQKTGVLAPYWVRLTGVGSVFTALTSPDGVTWTTLGSTTITMGTSAYIGIPATSHNATSLGTALIDRIATNP